MKKIGAAVAAVALLLSGCSGGASEPVKTVTVTATPGSAEFNDSAPDQVPEESELETGGLEAEFGKIIPTGDLQISMRIKGTDRVSDINDTNQGARATGFELQVENKGNSSFNASNSFVVSVSTDKGSGERADNVDNHGFQDLGAIGPGTKASMTVWFVLPKGATKASATAQVGGVSDAFDVNFSGPIKK